VICIHGDSNCTSQWDDILDTPETIVQTANNENYTFYVYLNGTVIFQNGTKLTDNGFTSVGRWIDVNVPTETLNCTIKGSMEQGQIFQDGRVIKASDKSSICNSSSVVGGERCFTKWCDSQTSTLTSMRVGPTQ
jgi:hypothetical protein